jgi:hypothetical protein
MDNDGYILGDYLTNAHYDTKDMPTCDIFGGHDEEPLPTTDAGNVALSMISRVNELHRVPIHVLMNQIGNLCNRYNLVSLEQILNRTGFNALLQNNVLSLILFCIQ